MQYAEEEVLGHAMDKSGKQQSSKSKAGAEDNPFRLIREIRNRIRTSNESLASGKSSSQVKYLWMHVTSDGIDDGSNGSLSIEHWLNVVDEAGALGVEWIVIGWEAASGVHEGLWDICRWAQDTHDCHVGIHILQGELAPSDVEALLELNRDRTHVLVDSQKLESVQHLAEHGIEICEADVNVAHRTGTCTLPDEMVCVGPEGKLYTCGLVLGNERFCLGSVFERAFSHVLSDDSLPHHVPPSVCREGNHHSCNACPPLMVERALHGRD